MRKLVFIVLLTVAAIVYAQPPVNISYSNSESNAATDSAGSVLGNGCLVQVLSTGLDGQIQPPSLSGATKGLPTGDDFVVTTAAIGDNLPPIPPFAGMFVSSGQVFFTPVTGQIGVGTTLYFRFFDQSNLSTASHYGNSSTYTTTSANGQTMERTGQTTNLLSLPLPATVSNVALTMSGSSATLQWNAAVNASGYNIYRTVDAYSWSSTPVATVTGTSWIDAGIVGSNPRYFYRVTATD